MIQGKYMRRLSLTTGKQVLSSIGGDGKIKSRRNASSMIDHNKRNIMMKQRKVSGSHAHSSGSDTAVGVGGSGSGGGVHLYHDALDGSSGSYSVPRSKNSSPIPGSGHFSTKNDK